MWPWEAVQEVVRRQVEVGKARGWHRTSCGEDAAA